MTKAAASAPVPEPQAQTEARSPETRSGAMRLGLRKRYLLLIAAVLLTVIPFVGWVVWHELELPGSTFAVLPSATPPFEPTTQLTVQPEPLPDSETVPATSPSPPQPDDARMDRLEELLERNTALLEQLARTFQVNEDAHLYMAEKIDHLEEIEAQSEVLSDMVYNIMMQVESLSPNASETATAVAVPPQQPSEDSPPFYLLAIDKWQHDWYAVLTLDGHVSMVTPPDSRAGWELVALDPAARKALFRNTASGLEHELEVR